MTDPLSEELALDRFRQQYYAVLAAALSREPSAEVLGALSQGIAERASAARLLHPLLGEGWDVLGEALPSITPASAADEFMSVFIGPFQPEIVPYESWYLTGQLFQGPLLALRSFLGKVGLERQEENYSDPEDALAFELEVMSWLLTRQLAADSAEEQREWQHRQAAFLRQHLLIWGPQCAQDIEAAKSATLYRGAALLLRGLFALEAQRVMSPGAGEIETLDQAKRRYGAPRTFQGPMFDPTGAAKPGRPPTSGGQS